MYNDFAAVEDLPILGWLSYDPEPSMQFLDGLKFWMEFLTQCSGVIFPALFLSHKLGPVGAHQSQTEDRHVQRVVGQRHMRQVARGDPDALVRVRGALDN